MGGSTCAYRYLLAMCLIAGLAACKVKVQVPEHGRVETLSGNLVCHPGDTCEVEVGDLLFDETFVAVADDGYWFHSWREDHRFLCGRSGDDCRLATAGFEGNAALEAFLTSDDVFFLEPVFLSDDAREEHRVTPAGGRFEFTNGVMLDIPEGAVSEPVTIRITELRSGRAQSILAGQTNGLSEKRFLGGFRATPDIAFEVPITATIPVRGLRAYELPVLMEMDLQRDQYWIEATQLDYRPGDRSIEVKVSHFSAVATNAIYNIDGQTLDSLCTDPRFNFLAICEDLDELQPAYCLLPREQRPPDASCCREGLISVRSLATDFLSNRAGRDCQALSSEIDVVFHDCRGPDGSPAPLETDELCEVSMHCEDNRSFTVDVNIEVPVDATSACFAVGERLPLEATVRDPDGNSLGALGVRWRSGNAAVAGVSDAGLVTARRRGSAPIEARSRHLCRDFAATRDLAVLDLGGTWNVTETADERDCEEGINVYSATVTLNQQGSVVSGEWPGGQTLSASKRGCSIEVSGSEREDDGVTRGAGSLRVSPDGNRMEGGGSWTWRGTDEETGQPISCSGTSEFVLTR